MCEWGPAEWGKWEMLVATRVLECQWLCPLSGWRVAFGAQVVRPQEGELGSRAEWRLLYVVRENKKAMLIQGGVNYSEQVVQMC